MIEIPGKIPLSIHPFFWVFALLIGWMMSGSMMGALMWLGIILVSVIVHEFGHAITAICFKQKARIQLIAFGGLTSYEGPKLKFWQQFLITFNGPLFGFFLFLGASLLLQFQWPAPVMVVLKYTQFANLFWTIVNLLPVMPLDGGQLMRIILEAFFGVKGYKASLLVSCAFAALLSFYFFMVQAFLIGAFLFLFAFQSFDSWRKSRHATREDRNDANRELMTRAEAALQEERFDEAKALLNEVREKAKNGLFAFTAAQYLAFLSLKEKKYKEAYDLLLPIKEHLSEDSLCILHDLAAAEKNYPLVCELSAACYQVMPTQKAALNNARAFAYESKAKEAGGWLQTAWQYGGLNLQSLLREEEFVKLKNDPKFLEFVSQLK